MLIEILPEDFFELHPELPNDSEWLDRFRLITLDRPVMQHSHVLNLENPLSEEAVGKIVEFLGKGKALPILISGSDKAVSEAVGEVLNWYFNRYLHRRNKDFKFFFRHCFCVIPDPKIYHLMMCKVLEEEHE